VSSTIGAAAVLTRAQPQSIPRQDDAAPALRFTTRLVQANVVVTDKHGNPIAGLSKDDFSLLDDKKPQEIQVFAVETDSPWTEPPTALPPGTYSNRLGDRASVPSSVTVILLDALNTDFAEQALTRKQVLRFLAQARPQDRIALYWLGNGLHALQEFTSDVASLREALARTAAKPSRDLSESDASYLSPANPNPSTPAGVPAGQTSNRDEFRSTFDQRVANESVKNRASLTAAALIAIAHHIGPLEGRKNLVWVSGGFPFSLGQEKFDLNWENDTGMGFSAEVARAAEAIGDAGIAVYPVDARGLMGTGFSAAGDFSEAPPPEFSTDENLPSPVAPGNLETMRILAERTGGKAFYGSNDLADAIRAAIDDSRVSYRLGFYPAGTTWDGRFHTIKVRVRIPGAQVRARTGYFALPDSSSAPPKSVERLVAQTAAGPLEATAIGMRVDVQPAGAGGDRLVEINLHLDPHEIAMQQANGYWTGKLQTVFLETDFRGQVLDALEETLQIKLPPETYEKALKGGIKNTKRLRVAAGASKLSIVLRDPSNGNLGSLTVPFDHDFPGFSNGHGPLGLSRTAGREATSLPEKLQDVVSRQQLSPPLHNADLRLEYSPDKQYLLLQSPAGIHVVRRQPLAALFYIAAPESYAARFSADSESVVVVSFALNYERWAVRDGKILENKALPASGGCVDARLSPDGELLACYRPDFRLGVMELSTGKWIFSDALHVPDPHLTIVPVPLATDVPFAEPFGFTLSRDMKLLANRAVWELHMAFSPDSKTLIAGDGLEAVGVDTVARRKVNLPGAIQKSTAGALAIADDARVVAIPHRGREPEELSLKDGHLLALPNFRADSFRLATDTRYAILHDSGVTGVRIFDLKENQPLELPESVAADVVDGELALVDKNGELSLARKGEPHPFASLTLSADALSPLRSVAVSSDLEKIAIAGDGEAGVYDVQSGRRILKLEPFSAASFVASSAAFCLIPERRPERGAPIEYSIDQVDSQGRVHASPKEREAAVAAAEQTVWHVDTASGEALPAWTSGNRLLRAGGPVFFDYSFENQAARGLFLPQSDAVASGRDARLPQGIGVPFLLRALDPSSGKPLWSRSFAGLPPIPVPDPQGERLVLSWDAKSSGAWAAAKHEITRKEVFKKGALSDQDSYLEVLEARTGKSLGGIVVESGSSPVDFDVIFSVGDSIIFSRDGVRVYVYSMLDGRLKARLSGLHPAANAQSKLLALDLGLGRLAIYDLHTGRKLYEQTLGGPIAFTHFSADGERLLVLTAYQEVSVLSMQEVRALPPGRPQP
jgi:VWFA-related protein